MPSQSHRTSSGAADFPIANPSFFTLFFARIERQKLGPRNPELLVY
uniref:Uncharacterized protein n=1 Tax=Arundo donax TaxID=35708 RepID=A0A0A9GJ68_ARUDO